MIKSKRKVLTFAIFLIVLFALAFSLISMTALSSYSTVITGLPSNVVSSNVVFYDESYAESSTNATVSIVGDGTALVENLSDSGYYTVTFFTEAAEVGESDFFLGDSGKVYSYEREYSSEYEQWQYNYTLEDTASYETYDTAYLLDISGDFQVTVEDVSADAAMVYIDVITDDAYGFSSEEVEIPSDGVYTLSNLGVAGTYTVYFADSEGMDIGYAEFQLDESGTIYEADYAYNDETGEWDAVWTETDSVLFAELDESDIQATDEETAEFSLTVNDVSTSVETIEVQYVDNELSTMDSYCETTINGDGTVTVDGVVSGYYTLNFYDSDYTCIGYTSFYVDDSGDTYAYTFENDATEPTLSAISDISCTAINTEENIDYTFGEMSVSVYDVPEEVDSISAMYYTGDETDEVVLFEPGYSSVYTEPLIVSELGMEGHYKLSFYLGDEILGNAEFYLDENGTIYEYDYEFNDQTNEWEQCLSETDEIYYSENTDIEDSDDYAYGNISLDLTNVPSDVAYVDTYYYENDDTFTTGCEFFPEITISNGKASITNLGEEGYYEVYLLASDGESMLGHVFFYMDSDSDIYLITYELNDDTNQMETIMTQTESIPLEEYADSTVDYQSGNMSVTIYEVPETVNRILVACVADDETYASFEKEIAVNDDNTIILDELGMAGNYTVTFMMDKDTLGSAMFYLAENGEIYDASYVYDEDGNVNTELTILDKIVFISSESSDDDIEGTTTEVTTTSTETTTETETTVTVSETDSSTAVTQSTTMESAGSFIGDVNLDGDVSLADSIFLNKYVAGIVNLSDLAYANSDLNDDTYVDAEDALILLKFQVGLVDSLPYSG